jgi:hypothetical protein
MKTLVKSLMALAAAAAISGSAYAIPTLVISDGITTKIIVDEAPNDGALFTPGAVLFSGSIGTWAITVNNGTTKPLIGSATLPDLDLSFLAVSSGAGTLSITFSDDGFTADSGFSSKIGGTVGSGGSVTSTLSLNGNVISNAGPFGPGAFSSTLGGNVVLGATDTLALGVILTANAGGVVSSGDYNVTVPDGGTTALLVGLGLVGMSVAARRKKA